MRHDFNNYSLNVKDIPNKGKGVAKTHTYVNTLVTSSQCILMIMTFEDLSIEVTFSSFTTVEGAMVRTNCAV